MTLTPRFATLIDLVTTRAAERPNRLAYAFLVEGEVEGPRLTYAELDAWARTIAVALREAGAEGGRALLLYPPGLEFVASFLGCLYAGVIAVPAYPPDPSRLARSLPRLQAIAKDARPAVVLTATSLIAAVRSACRDLPELEGARYIATDALETSLARSYRDRAIAGSDVAFLQYTSGSTSRPRGVMVGHTNILSNTESMRIAFDLSEDDVSVTWLPNFHDLGLIEGILMPLYTGHPCYIMAPAAFVKRPARWLEAVTRYRATHTGCPNFGYELCVRKVTREETSRLDLRSLRSAYNGAEPIRVDVPSRFYEAFAGAGLRPDVMFLCYGLAEATLMVSGGPVGSSPVIASVDGAKLEQHTIEPAASDVGARRLIGSGRLLRGNTVVIVDPETQEALPPNTVGEIWVGGALVAQGYWERPEETRATFRARVGGAGEGPFLRTGDLGFMKGDQLFCTGRIKDLLILDGTNHYPQDIEVVVERSHPAVRHGCSAAFAVVEGEDERLIVVAEVDNARVEALRGPGAEAVFAAIRGALSEREEIEADAIVLIAPGTIFKTSSGKIQRGACRAAYVGGTLDVVAKWQRPRPKSSPSRLAEPREADGGSVAAASEEVIRAFLIERLAERSGVPTSAIDPSATFARHGLSSRESVALAGELEARFGLRLSSTIVWEKPSIDRLARHLASPMRSERGREDAAQIGAPGAPGEGIAIVGIGCRFPKAHGPSSFHKLVRDGVDAIGLVPPDRWDISAFYDPDIRRPGKMNTKWGGFLDGVDRFDARFFGIAPREAERMDPQQRLALEVAWEALEDAGISAERARGTTTAVFLGASTYEYGAEQLSRFNELDGYAGTGSALNIIANRISYFLDLHGPSVVVDTACSSSLVAVHLACQSLRAGEAEMAIAGGLNLILSPGSTINASRMGNLAGDGRCKTFDARADGAVRSEGVGVVVLKPLGRALADGDRVYAVIRGTAVNQDGRSNGLMAPNPEAQASVLREAYRRAGVLPGQVHYVEAHGTGTLLGDPIEAKALGAVMGEGRPPGRPCLVGSVKTNIGHTESAAGAAGLIKMALSLHAGEVPKSLHFERPNPHIPFDALGLRVADQLEAWPDGPRYAGVSSFGWGGTNAHVVLEGFTAPAPRSEGAAGSDRARLLVVSAKTPEALRSLASRYKEALTEPEGAASLDDLGYSAAARRTHHEHRLAIVGRTRVEMRESLEAFLKGEARPNMSADEAAGKRRKIAFVCPGNGSQRVGMGRGLLATEPVFRDFIRRCDEIVRPLAGGFSIIDALEGDDEAWLARNDLVQPAIVALELALASLFASWGVEPEGVVGHSLGELPAAHLAGAMTLEDTLRVTCVRSALLLRLRGHGGMAMTELSLDEARAFLEAYGGRLTIGASNGPKSTVLSGELGALDEALALLESRGIFGRKIKADGAGHSPMVDPLCPELLDAIRGLRSKPTVLDFYSTVTGGRAAELPLDAEYWARNMREAVLFSSAVERLAEDGYDTFIELSAHPILLPSVGPSARRAQPRAHVLPSLKRGEDERATMLGALGSLYTAGHPVALERTYPKESAYIPLPAYPFQSERFWLDAEGTAFTRGQRRSFGSTRTAGGHPLLGERISSAAHVGVDFFKLSLSLSVMPEIGDHRLRGGAIVPAAVYMSVVRAAASAAQFGEDAALTAVSFGEALGVPDEGEVEAQLIVERTRPGEASFRLFSGDSGGGASESAWSLHCSGTISRRKEERRADGGVEVIAIQEVQARCEDIQQSAAIYERFAARGMEYGPSFQQIQWAARGERESLVRLKVREPGDVPRAEGGVTEASLDAAMQALAIALHEEGDDAYLPVGVEQVRWSAGGAGAAYGYATLRCTDDVGGGFVGDVALLDEDGRVVWSASGLRVLRAARRAERGAAAIDGIFYEVALRPAPPLAPRPEPIDGSWLIFSDQKGVGGSLLRSLEASGAAVIRVDHGGEKFDRVGDKWYRLRADDVHDFRALLAAVAADELPDRKPLTRVVHLFGLDVEAPLAEGASSVRAGEPLSCVSALNLLQAVAAQGYRDPPRVFFVTRGARPADGAMTSPAQAPIWGMARVAAYEHPELRVACVDLDPDNDEGEREGLVHELCSDAREDGVVLRKGERYVERLVPSSPSAAAPSSIAVPVGALAAGGPPRADHFRLQIDQPGTLGGLALREAPKPTPKAGQVLIDVRAAGLNFRDVLKALGVDLGLKPGDEISFGDECSGVITAVGPGVADFRVGDEVLAVAPSSHGSSVVAEARLVMHKPARLSFEEAATIPIAHLTALYALCSVGRLAPGESVLIHAAAGGVGLAAVRIAQRLGARVFATAGTPEKVAALRAIGVEHIMSSRTLAFVGEIERLTGGKGVDVVLNSLAGDFIPASLSVLAPLGRFLEIGRRDIAQNTPLGMKWLRRNVAVIGVDLFEVLFGSSTEVGDRLVQDLSRDLANGAIEPLPRTVFSMGAAEEAYRYMAEAKHVGKVVLSLPASDKAALAPPRDVGAIDPEGTYLIVGGLGGLGLVIARWLVLRGARSLVLVGRRGASEGALAAISALAPLGDVDVVVERADMSIEDETRRVLEGVKARGRALSGVVHAAVDMADATLLRATAEQVRRVMASKVDIAWNLHSATRDAPLGMFLMISSAAAILGSPGQAVYAAANAFLDALAHKRRADGLCATSVGFGAWSEAGGATAADKAGRLALRGLDGLTTEQGLLALSRCVESGVAHLGVMRLDLRRWRESYPQIADWPLLSEIDASRADVAPDASAVRKEILGAPTAAARRGLLGAHLRQEIGRVLRLSPDSIGEGTSFGTLGFDSLMAIELRNRLEASLGVRLLATMVWAHPSLEALITHIAQKLGVSVEREPEPPPTEAPPAVSLSDEEADALMTEKLAALEKRLWG